MYILNSFVGILSFKYIIVYIYTVCLFVLLIARDIPERRVAVYLNQLKENPYPTVTHQDGKMEPSAVSSISSVSFIFNIL